MANRILSTKLYLPKPRTNMVSRPRLLEQLNNGLDQGKALTLISAPAGYGKSLLISEWLHKLNKEKLSNAQVGWLHLDEGDNEPLRFMTYLNAALHLSDTRIIEEMESLFENQKLPPIEVMMTTWVNEIDTILRDAKLNQVQDGLETGSIVITLDDYHKIRHPYIHEVVQFILDHHPERFHLVVISREDPPVALARMRANDEITEIRAQELKFTLEETGQFFSSCMKLDLTEEWIRSLEIRTEGWIAGLQLAGVSIQGRKDVAGFLENFHGSHRYIIDYLMDEVLKSLPIETRDFLLKTSILDRFNPSLCDAVTGRGDASEMLFQIEQSNLFLVSLDDRREWYRYHHLFKDFLLFHAEDHIIPDLHLKAATWWEHSEYTSEAIDHFLSAQDYEHATRLIIKVADLLIGRAELSSLLKWLMRLPNQIVAENRELLSYKAWCLYFTGAVEEARDILSSVSIKDLDSNQDSPLAQGRLLCLKAWSSSIRESDQIIKLTEAALKLIGEADYQLRSATLILLGHGFRRMGDLESAAQFYKEAIQYGHRGRTHLAIVSAFNGLNRVLNELGRRHEALSFTLEAEKELINRRGKTLPIANLISVSKCVLCYEGNQLDQAMEHAQIGRETSQLFLSDRIMGAEVERVMILIQSSSRNFQAATEIIQETRLTCSHIPWIIEQIDALEADIHLRMGDLEFVVRWAERAQMLSSDHPSPFGENCYFPYIRLLLEQNKNDEANTLLNTIESSSSNGHRNANLITVLILKSLNQAAIGDKKGALLSLSSALEIALPGEYIRRFLDEGPKVKFLLNELRVQGFSRPSPRINQFINGLLDAFDFEFSKFSTDQEVVDYPLIGTNKATFFNSLVEPLSDQEGKILQLINAGMSNQEIASELVITVGTVKWHVHNIFSKLSVNSRTQLIVRAKDLGIL